MAGLLHDHRILRLARQLALHLLDFRQDVGDRAIGARVQSHVQRDGRDVLLGTGDQRVDALGARHGLFERRGDEALDEVGVGAGIGRRDGDRRGPGGFGPGGFGRRDGERGDGGGDFVERMMANDKNKDGKLTKDELPERMQRMFDNIDTNKDKELDKAELTKMSEQFNARFRSRGGDRGDRGGRNSDSNRPKRPESDNSDN